MLSTKKKGDEIFLTKNNKVISFMHDLKYKHLGYYRMVCEIPKGTKSKMEISTKFWLPTLLNMQTSHTSTLHLNFLFITFVILLYVDSLDPIFHHSIFTKKLC